LRRRELDGFDGNFEGADVIGVKVVDSEAKEEISVGRNGDCLVEAHTVLHDLTVALRINLNGGGLDEELTICPVPS
jgi:hypothetical protein